MLLDATVNTALPATVADYTRPALIVPVLRERDTPGIISELSLLLQRHGCVPDMLPFYHAALNQELLGNSALDCGVAFPHARLSGVKQVRFALGRTAEPVLWGARGSGQAQFIFLLAVPATDATSYLHLLASLARLGQCPELLDGLRTAETAESMHAVLQSIRMRQG